MVAHTWAAQSQDSGRNDGKSLYFKGNTIWSYGRHFVAGVIYPGKIVLINQHRYSPTTGKHLSCIYSATSHMTQYHVLHPDSPQRSAETKLDDLIDLIFTNFTARIPHSIIEIQHLINEYNGFLKVFKLPGKFKLSKTFEDMTILYCKHRREHVAKLKLKKQHKDGAKLYKTYIEDKAEIHKKLLEKQEILKQWLNGDVMPAHCDFPPCEYEHIRVKNWTIETTGLAEVPLGHGLRALKAIDKGLLKPGTTIGGFEFEGIKGDIITIGCHKLSLTQVRSVLNGR